MNCLMDNYYKSNNFKIKNLMRVWLNLDVITVAGNLKVSSVLPYSCLHTLTFRNDIIEVYHYSQLEQSEHLPNSVPYPIEKVCFWYLRLSLI